MNLDKIRFGRTKPHKCGAYYIFIILFGTRQRPEAVSRDDHFLLLSSAFKFQVEFSYVCQIHLLIVDQAVVPV